jgi:ABC-type multidrug transport system ATPase subunit
VSTVLTINQLTKKYGRITAVNALDLQVETGEVYGILGPNGSGKTTTLGILLGVVKQTSGTFSWFGEPASAKARRKVGAILEMPAFMPYLNAEQNLRIVCKIKEVPFSEIDRCLAMVNLLERKTDPFKTYSLGMKQRLAIASALLCDPGVLILDEPTNGLDPQGIAEIRELIISIANMGKTILLASHLLDEVQRVCSHFAVLKKGKRIYAGGVSEALGVSNLVEMKAENMQALEQGFALYNGVNKLQREGEVMVAQLADGNTVEQMHRHLVEKGVILSHLVVRKKSLEKQFLELLAQENE